MLDLYSLIHTCSHAAVSAVPSQALSRLVAPPIFEGALMPSDVELIFQLQHSSTESHFVLQEFTRKFANT